MKNVTNLFIGAALIVSMASCTKPEPSVFTPIADKIDTANYSKVIDGEQVSLFTLKSGKIGMKVTNYGARVVALCVPAKDGVS